MEKKYIVIKFPIDEYSLNTVSELHSQLADIFKDTTIIMIPSEFEWAEMSRDDLEQMRRIIDWALERKDDTNT